MSIFDFFKVILSVLHWVYRACYELESGFSLWHQKRAGSITIPVSFEAQGLIEDMGSLAFQV